MIGTTKLNGELYLLTSPYVALHNIPSNHFINVIHPHNLDITHNCNLWNLRFGRTSNSKLLVLNKKFPFVKIVNHTSPYEICFYAKKTNS